MAALNDTDAEKFADDYILLKQKELDIQKKYHVQFKEVLPMQKVALYYKSHDRFKREMLRRLRDSNPHRNQHQRN